MRDLKVVGLDVDGRHIICEDDAPAAAGGPTKFRLRVDDRLRAAVRGDASRVGQTQIDIEVRSVLRPKDIQARIRAGASVEQLAEASGAELSKIERFAHPVLLERARAAELATAAHPVLADGPAVLTLLESVTTALVNRGLNPDDTAWDAWRNEDGRWTVQLAWKAGRSDNVAHFRFVPGAHGGTVTALDDTATELIDPDFDRPLRPVAPLPQLEFESPAPGQPAPAPKAAPKATPKASPEPAPAAETAPPARAKRAKPAVPAWEDVLLGVRSSGDR
ncbi:DNA-binding protein [Mycolicibacterium chitae]|uniref:Protein of uncharacterized function (DUF3071) n=1 Tax=Mycolicibacterium chitae TaxID=1792 RepID=A0A3S4VEK7_MYCCI|nr:septation protein SepH [Mycolicibacterium chitae]MCV7108672.1 DUF3071 domain-containing protein [Mycolicibacterium chitae]BBZ02812.1 DNA-binding protein [Mycolicibacterium chitae]VEG45736.1 Protein of uncharacterised function (DUF3071) [Mycolicibacterium chitae]